MYSLPQEIEVWYIIPTIRKELAKILTKRYNMTLEKAGNILGVSKAAVSHYLKSKRAKSIKLPKYIKNEIKKSAEKITKNNSITVKEITRILNLIKKYGCECEICKKYNKGILEQCKMNPIKSHY